MLSFDITDRKIRIIKGTESSGKIKISAAAEIELEEAVIVNGRVNDINRVAVMINQVLKRNNMPDKEAIIAISSNQTVFKELQIPPNPKESEFMKEIRTQLKVQINVDESYSVAYVIVGEPEEGENGEKLQKVLVTACPGEVVECYRSIFRMLGITLKTVMIGCNAITKVLLADAKIKSKMPLLAVQIDKGFISLNLYEDNQLSFSRFASIDPDDYENPDDYVFEAVNENIFRMLQFARSRGTDNISNVVFYGDVNASQGLYNRLIDEMSNNEISVSQLNVPPQIHGYQNLEFALYANAIGAMFKRNKLTEHINLLELESAGAAAGKVKADNNFIAVAIASLAVTVVAVGGVWAGLGIWDKSIKDDTAKLQADIDSPETAAKLAQYDMLLEKRDVVNNTKTLIQNTSDAYKTQPVVTEDYYLAIEDGLAAVQADLAGAADAEAPEGAAPGTALETPVPASINYSNGVFDVPVSVVVTDPYSQQYPAALVQYYYDEYADLFSLVTYSGYSVSEEAGEEGEEPHKVATFSLQFTINTSDKLPDLTVEEETTAEDGGESTGEEAAAE